MSSTPLHQAYDAILVSFLAIDGRKNLDRVLRRAVLWKLRLSARRGSIWHLGRAVYRAKIDSIKYSNCIAAIKDEVEVKSSRILSTCCKRCNLAFFFFFPFNFSQQRDQIKSLQPRFIISQPFDSDYLSNNEGQLLIPRAPPTLACTFRRFLTN